MRVDYDKRQIQLSSGRVFNIRPVSTMVTARLQKQIQDDMPQPPIIEVKIGDSYSKEENRFDPTYLAALRQWQVTRSQALMVYVWTSGIVDPVPQADHERLRVVFGDNETEIKYAYILEQIGDDHLGDWGEITEAILSQSTITKRGIETSMETFRPNGGIDTDRPRAPEQTPGDGNVLVGLRD